MPAKLQVTLELTNAGSWRADLARQRRGPAAGPCRILLHADQGEGGPGKIDAEIAEAVGVSMAPSTGVCG